MKSVLSLLVIGVLTLLTSCKKEETATLPTDDNTTETNHSSPYPQYGEPFQGVPETEDVVMYEINLRALGSENKLQAVINKLEHIKSLGVNVLWLMPIYPAGEEKSVGSPYAVKDYKAIGEEYGTLEDLRKLTDKAHELGMAVILDWVANHSAWDNAWIENKDWYTQNAEGEIIHPAGTNWQDVADLNYENNEMRQAMLDAMLYWIFVANVDGFRCDHADGVPFDFWENALDEITSIPNRKFVLFAEGEREDHFDAGFDLNFSWLFYARLKDVFNGSPVSRVFEVQSREYPNTSTAEHWVRYTTNHDESAWDATPIRLFNGKAGALAASVLSTFIGGVPLIYSSQEVATENNVPFFSNSSINWGQNPSFLNSFRAVYQFYTSSEAAKTQELTSYSNFDVACFTKKSDSEEIAVVVNVRNASQSFSLPTALQNRTVTHALSNEEYTLNSSITLNAYEYLILKL